MVAGIMDKSQFDIACERVVTLNAKAIDICERDLIQPILDEIKNPEKVLGKKYELWTPQDFLLLTQVYQSTPDILSEFIAKKEYDSLVVLQSEV
jgi:hypothetical protein